MGQRAYPKPERLAAKLLVLRRSLGLSQTQMAERLNFYGYYSPISEFEKGRLRRFGFCLRDSYYQPPR